MTSIMLGKRGLIKIRSKLINTLRTSGSGYKLSAGVFTSIMAYTYFKGPHIHSELLR